MVSKEIENIYKNKKEIQKEYLELDTSFANIVNWNKNSKNKGVELASEEMANNFKEFYLDKIGEENMKNSPDYDPDLVQINRQFGEIKDLNFPTSFLSVFLKTLVIDFAAYFFFGFMSLLFGGLISLILVLLAWIAPIFVTLIFYLDYNDEIKLFKKSTIKTEHEKQKFNNVKYAPLLSFLILVIVNIISGYFLINSLAF
jgi:hypothetical protein